MWDVPQFFSDWAFRAVSSGDTLSEFRTIEIDIDSAASLHWGSQLKEAKSTYMTGETVRTDYEYHNYGLTLDLQRSEKGGIRGKYSLAQRDDVNSIIEGNFGGEAVIPYRRLVSLILTRRPYPEFRSCPRFLF